MSPIARLKGIVEERGPDWLVVAVGSIGFLVHAAASVLAQAKLGDEIDLYTHLIAREEGMALYGFASADERRLFQMLIAVSGVGPKVALALLSALRPDELAYAIASGNAGALAKAPGVGQKLAGRIVLELRGRLAASAPTALPSDEAQVVEALLALGYSQVEAMEAVAQAELPAGTSFEDKVRLSLQYFARR